MKISTAIKLQAAVTAAILVYVYTPAGSGVPGPIAAQVQVDQVQQVDAYANAVKLIADKGGRQMELTQQLSSWKKSGYDKGYEAGYEQAKRDAEWGKI